MVILRRHSAVKFLLKPGYGDGYGYGDSAQKLLDQIPLSRLAREQVPKPSLSLPRGERGRFPPNSSSSANVLSS